MRRILPTCLLLLYVAAAPAFAQHAFTANCASGEVSTTFCTVTGGIIQNPVWWNLGSLWRIGDALTVKFNLRTEVPNYIELNVQHTGSWGENELTLGKIIVNGNLIVDSYVPPDHMLIADTFRIPREYLNKGSNTIVFALSGGDFVWWIRAIEARW
jgi:hypothetical protein